MTTILVIEDQPAIRENIEEILELNDYDVITAEDGTGGVNMARQHQPDLILCDVRMPQLDGYGVLMKLQSDFATSHIPFIFLTALTEREAMRKGMAMGADDYITKPFSPDELVTAVQTRLDKHNMLVSEYERQIEQLRGAVVHMLPHELRTPLTVIIGYSELILTGDVTVNPGEVLDMVSSIRRAGGRLVRLMENILLYAQIEVNKSQPLDELRLDGLRTQSPVRLIERVAKEEAVECGRTADLEVTCKEIDSLSLFSNDLKKCVQEVVNNALKFSDPGKPVRLTGELKDGAYQLTITDYGHGMTPEQIDQLSAFTQFERMVYEQQGAGLGLAIVKGLLDIYGGEIEIKSKPNERTDVTLVLPT